MVVKVFEKFQSNTNRISSEDTTGYVTCIYLLNVGVSHFCLQTVNVDTPIGDVLKNRTIKGCAGAPMFWAKAKHRVSLTLYSHFNNKYTWDKKELKTVVAIMFTYPWTRKNLREAPIRNTEGVGLHPLPRRLLLLSFGHFHSKGVWSCVHTLLLWIVKRRTAYFLPSLSKMYLLQ